VNGPHQGAWVVTPQGEDWFIHFQDRYAYGRIIHLQPMRWANDWPVIGSDPDGDGCGEPVMMHAMPVCDTRTAAVVPQMSDEFASPRLGLQWQWEANHQSSWYSLSARSGVLRLAAVPMPDSAANLWDVPNLLCQKFPAEKFTTTTLMECEGLAEGERAGLVVFGMDYGVLAVKRDTEGLRLEKIVCPDANKRASETIEAAVRLTAPRIYARVTVDSNAVCVFSYSSDGEKFVQIGRPFTAREGLWVGAKVGVFANGARAIPAHGHADFEWFRIE
jgi:beta-xylosidase